MGYSHIKNSYGAIIMATGITISLPISDFIPESIIKWITTALITIILFLIFQYTKDAFYRRFYRLHLQHPLTSFANGTWVAGISVGILIVVHVFPSLTSIAKFFFIGNVVLWLLYILLVVRNFFVLSKVKEYRQHTNGILLLSCVSTQSIVLSGETLFGDWIPGGIFTFLIYFGFSFYLLSLLFMTRSILTKQIHNLADNWMNMNCIIHGALSITGYASIMTHATPNSFINGIWWTALILVLAIEGIEYIRMVQRVKRYGWRDGVFSYSRTQWARNFTLAMFLTFTLHFSPTAFHLLNRYIGAEYIVLLLILIEYILFLQHILAVIVLKSKGRVKDEGLTF
ncbi:hypothetical protein [Oikeobacillus pervagus]|nr:hypothetical protein [Oikeobacillus pervagus]